MNNTHPVFNNEISQKKSKIIITMEHPQTRPATVERRREKRKIVQEEEEEEEDDGEEEEEEEEDALWVTWRSLQDIRYEP